MKISPLELIVFPHNADLDHLGAVRCLSLQFPEAKILHPVRFKQNAWETARKLDWFKTINFSGVDFANVHRIHLVGISQPRQNKELIEAVATSFNQTVVYSDHQPGLPFPYSFEQINALSLTASLLAPMLNKKFIFSDDDIFLFTLAVTEKTWAGLSSRCRSDDQTVLNFLRSYHVSPARVANAIVLGMREGQTGLYNHMRKNVEDIQYGYWPISFIAVKSAGHVQDLEPVVDAIWSDLAQPILIIMITANNFSRIWARSSLSQVDFFDVLAEFRPSRHRNWVFFNFSGNGHEQNRETLLQKLKENLKPDLTAGDIMSAAPQCIDWNSTIQHAFDLMLKFNIMSLIVTREDEFAGIVTRRDLDRALQMNLLDAIIGPYVPTSIPIVSPSTPVRVLKSLMVRYNLTRLPVLDGKKISGIITTHELLRFLPDNLPLPPDFLPLAEQIKMPDPSTLEDLVKRVFSLKIYHLLSKIGRFAAIKKLAVFAVGGFVRDLLLERPNFDIDIVVIGDAMSFSAALSTELACEHKVFDRFHTARIYLEDLKVDFSSARIEHYANPGALPQIEYSGLSNDLYRRDFTINALALALNPEHFLELKDFFGGYNDLLHRRIRILHSFSFLEDPTRLFRALRFAGRFNFSLEQDTRRAFDLAISREALLKLSIKRIAAEISRSFNEERPQDVIASLFSAGLMRYLSPELVDASILPGRFKLIKGFIKRFMILGEDIDAEAIYWSGLLSVLNAVPAAKILDATGTPHSRRVKILQALQAMNTIPSQINRICDTDNLQLYELLTGLEIETLLSLMAFSMDKRNARKILHFISNLRRIKCSISGNDLLAIGVEPGPLFRQIFQHIIYLKLNGADPSPEEELEIARKFYQNLQV